MTLEELPTLPDHRPHQRVTRRHSYLICSCGGFDIRTAAGVELPWYRWKRHLDEVRVDA